jgi:hypothetical protein
MQAVGGAYSKADLFSGGLSDFDTGLSANINDTQAAQAALAAAAATRAERSAVPGAGGIGEPVPGPAVRGPLGG